MVRAGGAVNRNQFPIKRGRKVHQTTVVAHDRISARQQINCLRKIGFAAKIGTQAV